MADRPSRDFEGVPEAPYAKPERDVIVDPDTGRGEGPSIAALVQDIVQDVQELVRTEIKLAKTEVKEEAQTAGRAAAFGAVAAVLALYAGFFLLLASIFVLDLFMEQWLAGVVVALVVTAAAAAAGWMAYQKFKEVNPKPDDTIASVKEDVKWAKQQAK